MEAAIEATTEAIEAAEATEAAEAAEAVEIAAKAVETAAETVETAAETIEAAAEAAAAAIMPTSSPSTYTGSKYVVKRRPLKLKGYSEIDLAQWQWEQNRRLKRRSIE